MMIILPASPLGSSISTAELDPKAVTQVASATASSEQASANAGAWHDLDSMTITFVKENATSDILLFFQCSLYDDSVSAGACWADFKLLQDSTLLGYAYYGGLKTSNILMQGTPVIFKRIASLPVASYVFKVQWHSVLLRAIERNFIVLEVKR
jgi:hypothetical protein